MEEKEFNPITSQEALDAVIKDRLNRQSEKHSKELAEVKAQYADYDELKSAKDGYEAQLNELTTKLNEANGRLEGVDSQIAEKDKALREVQTELMKEKAVRAYNLSDDAVEFLKGETEEEIIESAIKLSKLSPKKMVAPLASGEAGVTDPQTQAFKSMLVTL